MRQKPELKFKSYDCPTGGASEDRLPDKGFQKEISKRKKTVITCSDDEEDETAFKPSTVSSTESTGDGWLDTRADISQSERRSNSSKAALDLKIMRKAGAPTTRTVPNISSSSMYGVSSLDDTPEGKKRDGKWDQKRDRAHHKLLVKASQSVKRGILQSSMVELVDVDDGSVASGDSTETTDSSTSESSDDSDDNNHLSHIKKKQREEVIDVDDDDGVELPEIEYLDATKEYTMSRARSILKRCRAVSAELQQSVSQWSQPKKPSTTSADSSTTADDRGDVDCINLLSISKPSTDSAGISGSPRHGKNELLLESDIQINCPNLVLKEYQLVGVNWLKLLHQSGVNGVLADDMGLGKTVQSISFLGWLRQYTNPHHQQRAKKPHLIVVPASTLSNWIKEWQRFCPSFNIVTYHGSQAERSAIRRQIKRDLQSQNSVDVVMTTYSIFEKESAKDDRKFIYNLCFEYLILDEAHCIKNSKSSRYVNLMKCNAKKRLLLSGTPVQNDLGELLALLSFLMPKVFGSQDSDILLEAFGWKDKKKAKNGDGSNSQHIKQLRRMLAPFVLRRLKIDVLNQLPAKVSTLKMVEMTAFQDNVYQDIISSNLLRKERIKLTAELEARSEIGGISVNRPEIDTKVVNRDTGGLQFSAISSGNDGNSCRKQRSAAISASVSISDQLAMFNDVKFRPNIAESKAVVTSNSSVVDLTVESPSKEGVANSAACSLESCASGKSVAVRELTSTEARHVFTALRKAANHPLLLRVRFTNPKMIHRIAQVALAQEHFGKECYDIQKIRDELETYSDFDLHCLCLQYPQLNDYILDKDVLYDSPKLAYLQELLPELIRQDHRMLIFSQWTRILDLLEVLLDDMNLAYLRLDGSTPVKERQELIDVFSEEGSEIPIFLLSTKAGGLGINLCAADTVIMHDLDFNPENDKQAEDRCHRIGQVKPVNIIKLVAKDTVDEDIYQMGERKSMLSKAVLDGTGGQMSRDKEEGEGDVGAIGRILQRAFMRQGGQGSGTR